MGKGDEKMRRMELRRATGTRLFPEPPAPRGRFPRYLIAHACFTCRKSWKVEPHRSPLCPQCGGPLAEMGRSFKAPKTADREQWEKVRRLWLNGFRFFSYRSHPEAEALPERLPEVEGFIRRNPGHPGRVRRRG